MHDQLIAEVPEKANIAKAEAILRTALVMPVTEYQLQNREWARGVLADAWMAAKLHGLDQPGGEA